MKTNSKLIDIDVFLDLDGYYVLSFSYAFGIGSLVPSLDEGIRTETHFYRYKKDLLSRIRKQEENTHKLQKVLNMLTDDVEFPEDAAAHPHVFEARKPPKPLITHRAQAVEKKRKAA